MTREEALFKAKDVLDEATEYENAVCYVTGDDREWLELAIKALEQGQKTGHWIYHKEKPFISVEHWECSECHRTVEFYPFIVKTSFGMPNDYNTMYFCPKCGAKMESEVSK